ncbi:DUF2169 family type VI secretion system accessory protein [Thiohalocapsa marina]|uniref:DUF2169 family type VI secretion system accessory protein n=1 Tax=Thiohalocapsa marina TaxID=424902 RepID=UPI001478B980|nr:DUF2169 domain-containing protein [Thiohalocapsa marina]
MSASLLTRPFEHGGRFMLGVSVILFSTLGRTSRLLTEQQLWPFWASRPESQGPLEEGYPRPRAEYLVGATAFTRADRRRACRVRAQVGNLSKELVVWGLRFWEGERPSAPLAFERLALDWSQTYGGEDFAANPVGMGRRDSEIDGTRMRLLPRVEYPDRPLTRPSAVGRPAGFGPLDQTWATRAAKRGTYDQAWLERDYPGLARDLDGSFFNLAPEDQQQATPFRGDEGYAFDLLHPELDRIEGVLPGLATRVFATRKKAADETFEELSMSLKALWFFPEEERLIQVFQGWMHIGEDDAADVQTLLAAVERLGEARPSEHYRAVQERRRDPDQGALESLRESDLMPADLAVSLFDPPDKPSPAYERAMRRAARERAEARALVAAHGLDPDEHGPPADLPDPPRIQTLDDLIDIRKRMEAESAALAERLEQEKRNTLDEVRVVAARDGVDMEQIEREMSGDLTRGPPRPNAEPLIADLTRLAEEGRAGGTDVAELEQMLSDPDTLARWREGDRQQLAAYQATGHHQRPPDPLAEAAREDLRVRVQAELARGGSLAGWDLTRADLSRMDLRGADLSGALLEAADLSGALLDRAKLSRAMLAHARLIATRLIDADLRECNLGAAQIARADLSGADLSEAILERARLGNSTLHGARIEGLRLTDAEVVAVDFSATEADSMVLWREADLRGCSFAGIRYAQAVFQDCNLEETDFTGASITKAAFVGMRARRSCFRDLSLGAGCFALNCQLDGVEFSGARLNEVSFREASLRCANFSRAELRGCDFSGCNLRETRFYAADARGARLVRADLGGADLGSCNLAGAVLQHARLERSELSHANLHEADLARVQVGPGVRFDGAIFTRARTRPRYRPPERAD